MAIKLERGTFSSGSELPLVESEPAAIVFEEAGGDELPVDVVDLGHSVDPESATSELDSNWPA